MKYKLLERMQGEYNKLYSDMLKGMYEDIALTGTSIIKMSNDPNNGLGKIQAQPQQQQAQQGLTGQGQNLGTVGNGQYTWNLPPVISNPYLSPGQVIWHSTPSTMIKKEFKTGQKVRRVVSPFFLQDGATYTIAEVVGMKMRFQGETGWEYMDEFEEVLELYRHRKCECGSDSVGGVGHSSYCPKHEIK